MEIELVVELAIIPVLLGSGRPFPLPLQLRRVLSYQSQRVYPSGIVLLQYSVADSGSASVG